MPGEFGARKLKQRRKKFKGKCKKRRRQIKFLLKKDPLEGAPIGRAIVLKKRGVVQKQPHSGIIKTVRCQIVKNGIQVTAFVPGTNAIKFIDEHDTVGIVGVGGSQRGAVGSMHGIKYKVLTVNGISLNELLTGKKEKPRGA